MDRTMTEGLDRWLTGNYGEDELERETRMKAQCAVCHKRGDTASMRQGLMTGKWVHNTCWQPR